MMATKTYILAPNFTYKPSGPIQIGSIIADPFRPAKPLSTVAAPPAYETVFHHNLEAACETGQSVNVSLWAHILDAAGGGTGASRRRKDMYSLSVDRLETRYLAQEPMEDDPGLIGRVKEPRVQAAIKAGIYGHAPVYLISGVKIARGLVVRTERGGEVGASLTATAPAAQAVGIDIGASVEGERSREISSTFDVGDQEIVVAYQLHVIRVNGRLKERIAADVFESDAAFLHGAESDEEEQDIEMRNGGVDAMAEAAQEMDIELETEKINRPDGRVLVCMRARDK